jgi:ribosomal protein S19
MGRSVWKGPFVDAYVLKKAEAARESGHVGRQYCLNLLA